MVIITPTPCHFTIYEKLLKDHLEAIGHKEAFEFVNELVKDNVQMSESIIKQIHYLVLADKKDDCGVYLRVPVCIMGVQHKPVHPYLILPVSNPQPLFLFIHFYIYILSIYLFIYLFMINLHNDLCSQILYLLLF